MSLSFQVHSPTISGAYASQAPSSPLAASDSAAPAPTRASEVFQRESAVVNIGDEAKQRAEQGAVEAANKQEPDAPQTLNELSEEEEQQVREMQARDREVRTHEQAHKSAGGSYTGAIHLDFERGPDGKRYAVSGHVDIDVSPVKGDPEATIQKMAVVARAALAPAQPSSADRAVAAKANATASQARAELATERAQPEDEQTAQSFSTQGLELVA